MSDPRALSDLELAAAIVRPLELVNRPDLAAFAPHNLIGYGGPDQGTKEPKTEKTKGGEKDVETDITIPGLGVGLDVPSVPDVAAGIGSTITNAVLGPVAEIVIQTVLTTIAGGLLVWAVIAMARRSETAQYANDVGIKAAGAIVTKGL